MEYALLFDKVVKNYGNTMALQGIDVQVRRGEVVAILGPNGAGKSTAISLILGLRRPTSGFVRVLGSDPGVPHNRAKIGAMLQQVSVPDKVKVRELIELFRSYYPNPMSTSALMSMSDLDTQKETFVQKLSGGQKRRLQFALAMAGNPDVVFLDEPTVGMDVASRRTFWGELQRLHQVEGRTILFTTHQMEEADGFANRILLLHRGRLLFDGTPSELKDRAGNRFVSFDAGDSFDLRTVKDIEGVLQAEQTGRRVRILTQNSDDILRALVLSKLDIYNFEVSRGGLEDAFISLTKDADEAMDNHAASADALKEELA